MLKKHLQLLSRFIRCAILIPLTMSNNIRASEFENQNCNKTHTKLRQISANLDPNAMINFQVVEQDTSSSQLTKKRVLGCKFCNKFLNDQTPNLKATTSQGEQILIYVTSKFNLDEMGIVWGSLPTVSQIDSPRIQMISATLENE